ncbi:hypothetical protein H4R26_002278, partial [Coemansia thaxteri]
MSYHRRSSVTLPQSATLDERILGLHPPGAMYKSGFEYYNTVVEQRMRRMSSAIRARSGWIEALGDADTRAGWAKEAKEQSLTDLELCYVLDELAYFASLSQPGNDIRLSAVDGVWISDLLVDLETTEKLKDYTVILKRMPSCHKDYWNSNPKNRVLNLIDPSLYPLVYSRSKLLRPPSTSPQAALAFKASGESPGTLEKWREALSGADDTNGSKYYLPTPTDRFDSIVSNYYSWLPSEFSVNCNGAVEITSYINNLHPFLPMLEQVVTDLVRPRGDRLARRLGSYYKSDKPEPDMDDYEYHDEYDEDIDEWKKNAKIMHPHPKSFVAPERPITPYTLYSRQLQAVVRMSNIELTPNCPRYRGDSWEVTARANERIIATGVFFYDVSNISRCSLQLREPVCGYMFGVEQYDIRAVVEMYGINDHRNEELRLSQNYGNIDINDGLCVVYPSIYQHQMSEFKLANSSKPGHCRMLTFYFVDPATRVPSTAIVPPQQQEWWFEDVLASEPFCNLPHLILDGIANRVDFPISLDEAKRIRKR